MSRRQADGTPIYVGRHVVGQVVNGVFVKRLRSTRHQLRQPPAWAFDVSSLRDAAAAGAERVRVIDKDTGNRFEVSMSHLRRKGFELDRGHGRQWVLTLNEWQTTEKKPQAKQLRLI